MSIERYSVADILVNTGHTLSCQWYSGDTVVDPGTVTVTITDADGNAVVEDGATGGTDTAARTYTLTPAQNASLTTYTAVWVSAGDGDAAVVANSSVTTYAEVVGDLLFGLAEARAFDNAKFTAVPVAIADAALVEARARIAGMLHDIIGVPVGLRYKRVVCDGNGKAAMLLPDTHITSLRNIAYRTSGTQTWTAYTSAELADVIPQSFGLITRETLGAFAAGIQNIRVGYEYGIERIPLELKDAALQLAVDTTIPSDIDPRASSFSDGIGTYRLVTPGLTRNAYTSIPGVNEVLNRLSARVPGVG